MTETKDIFGLSSLVNSQYTIPQTALVEQNLITGANDSSAKERIEKSAAEMFKARADEIEKSIGAPIFNTREIAESQPDAQHDFANPQPAGILANPQLTNQQLANPQLANQQLANQQSTESRREVMPTLSTEGIRFTEEAQKRDRLASALNALSIGADGILDVDRENDRKLVMIEEIEDLLSVFKDNGEDMSHVHVPTAGDPTEVIQSTLKILRRHNDMRRFSSFADDCIMLAAASLEELCDGKRDWFGFKPNLVGWSNQVRAKLKRMHHDTAQIASSVFNDYNIGPGTRLMFELVPNLVMYGRMRATDRKNDGNDANFDAAINRLNQSQN